MPKRIYFNAFHMNCVVHQSPGLWVRPDQIADKLQEWTQAGVDGFNLAYAVLSDTKSRPAFPWRNNLRFQCREEAAR